VRKEELVQVQRADFELVVEHTEKLGNQVFVVAEELKNRKYLAIKHKRFSGS
jgi:hypothetical protein